ncbi:hypothetical protein G3O00_19455 [Burkholderia sp. Ac-20384]|uniref:hypothetical protein n=1 Tax=Burkholderia sp. Ac-20384 TaxID=2703902 RepID=UPI001980EF85|nr:hypothetical protein [Burkholderia sp. Ac-20384]MBN3825785.1 hypothetical protein [Burkholderia sp. Ac-20384]
MVIGEIDVEANGIVLLDQEVLHETLGWRPVVPGERDLMSEFFSSDLGDEVVKKGAIVPLLSIDDGGYEIICRLSSERSTVEDLVVTRNGCFPLLVEKGARFYDLENLMHWPPSEVGVDSQLRSGFYSVTINGFRSVESGRIVRAGYEFVCEPTDELIEFSAEIDKYMRVFF